MPVFMDRHEMPGVTAEVVAQAHLSDLAIEADYGVQFLAYWFDADREEVFCLAKAPAQGNMEAVHRASHGMVPNEIINVSEDNVLRFLGRITDPVDSDGSGSPFRTILFTDLQGSTALLQSLGEPAFMVVLAEHDLIIRRALAATRGREVKHTGDGIMASFDDVANALECSLAIQSAFATRALEGARPELGVRIGIAAGEPVDHNDDLFGSTVNLASRICDTARAGHILTSDLVHELGSEKGFTFDEGHDYVLKGFAGPTCVYELLQQRS